jgi:hypothetical protein
VRKKPSTDSLLSALEVLRQLYASGERKLTARVPTAFGAGVAQADRDRPVIDRRTWEVAVVMTLRDRLRAGDIWVEGSCEGSRAFRAFDDFLLPARRVRGQAKGLTNWTLPFPTALKFGATNVLGISSGGFEKSQTGLPGKLPPSNRTTLVSRISLAASTALLSHLPIPGIARRGQRLDRFCKSASSTFAPASRQKIRIALMTAGLADVTNLGLARMSWSSGVYSHTQLFWTAEWHLRDETSE